MYTCARNGGPLIPLTPLTRRSPLACLWDRCLPPCPQPRGLQPLLLGQQYPSAVVHVLLAVQPVPPHVYRLPSFIEAPQPIAGIRVAHRLVVDSFKAVRDGPAILAVVEPF